MHFGLALELSNIDLSSIDLLDTHLDLLDTDTPSKYFGWLHNAFQDVFKMSCKMCSRRLGRRKIVTLNTCWRQLQEQKMFAGDVPLTEKPGLHKEKLETVPEGNQ